MDRGSLGYRLHITCPVWLLVRRRTEASDKLAQIVGNGSFELDIAIFCRMAKAQSPRVKRLPAEQDRP